MCCSPEARAQKAQRERERYERRHDMQNSTVTVVVVQQTTGAMSGNEKNLVLDDMLDSSENVLGRPPSYRAVVEKQSVEHEMESAEIAMLGEAVDGFAVRERRDGNCRGGRGGCCARKADAIAGCGGRRRSGLVAMLFRVLKGQYDAYKDGKVDGGGTDAGREMMGKY